MRGLDVEPPIHAIAVEGEWSRRVPLQPRHPQLSTRCVPNGIAWPGDPAAELDLRGLDSPWPEGRITRLAMPARETRLPRGAPLGPAMLPANRRLVLPAKLLWRQHIDRDRSRDRGNMSPDSHSTAAPRDLNWFREMLCEASSHEAWRRETEAKNRELQAFESLAWRTNSGAPDAAAPLAGVPVGIKALFAADGFPTTAGSSLPPELFAQPEARAVRRLKDAGAFVLGKTKTDEFAYADPPDTKNPRDPTRTPGGSSAGSAAAVAAGMVPIALGTQTSRSIIAPASFCGVVGFKPSFGRIPCDGVVLLSPAMDTVGTLATSIEDTRDVARVLIDGWDETERGPARFGAISPLLRKSLLEGFPALDAYERLIAERAWPTVTFRWEHDIRPVYQNAMDLLHGEMALVHQRWFAEHEDRYREMSRKGIERGQAISPDRTSELRSWALRFRKELAEDLAAAGVDVLVLPAQPREAPPLGKVTGFGHTTIPWSVSGLPCVSIPWSHVDGLPIGLQGVAAFGMDETLLQTMQGLELRCEPYA